MNHQSRPVIGLEGVAAAETRLSHVEGERGELIIAGEYVGDLAFSLDFEALVARLWALAKDDDVDADHVRLALGKSRREAFSHVPSVLSVTEGMPLVDAFRVAIAALQPSDQRAPEITLLGAMPVIAAALVRRSEGQPVIEPDPAASHAGDFLRMLRGSDASAQEIAALNAYLITVSDHGMNASTFTSRVVASTHADLFMAVTAAYCALSGPLHGGAPEPVLDMLDAIGSEDRIEDWVDAALARGDRLMGFGHRIYRVRDPRADVLKAAVERLHVTGKDLGLATQVEAYARQALARHKPGRKLETNVEFFTAILLDALQIPRQAFTPVFAAGRTAGWTAHAIEQQRTGRLLRPAATYTGAMPG